MKTAEAKTVTIYNAFRRTNFIAKDGGVEMKYTFEIGSAEAKETAHFFVLQERIEEFGYALKIAKADADLTPLEAVNRLIRKHKQIATDYEKRLQTQRQFIAGFEKLKETL